MAWDGYRQARRVYGHSFYRQGTSDKAASADTFIAAALGWFGDVHPEKGSAWAKGERLAELVRAEPTLLILDGLEPLQYPPGPSEGRVTDRALRALLRALAAQNPGLCVITTREHVGDLDPSQATTRQTKLDVLPTEAGAHLLRELGAKGPANELEQASVEFGDHALALTLLATYLRKAHDGDVRKRSEVSLMTADEEQGGHAKRVMASYEKWLKEHERHAELSVLRILGLFNRPAEAGCVAALRDPPAIADLTDRLVDISEADWNIALSNLREAGLVATSDPDEPGALDAHPLVREHFAEELRRNSPDAWREGHNRLYEYLKGPGCKKEFPDTIEDMAPLYAAMIHGCAAGRYQEALEDVYTRRIHRGSEFFSTRKLGAFGTDLGALSRMFDEPWGRVPSSLSDEAESFLLNEVGFALRALGRLAEAVAPMLVALEETVAQERWGHVVAVADNVSELYLTQGRVGDAVTYARRSVNFAERSGEWQSQVFALTTLADALQHAGQDAEADVLFQKAERLQKQRQPDYPVLYGPQGYQYCDLLLARRDHRGVIQRAAKALEWDKAGGVSRLGIALGSLSLGRAHLLEAKTEGTDAYKRAWAHLDLAVDGLREAGIQDFLARGLLARAELYVFTGDYEAAQADLNEAVDIATRDPQGQMKLHIADCRLGYARLALAKKDPATAGEHLKQARDLIEETAYHRRDAELEELERQAGLPPAASPTK